MKIGLDIHGCIDLYPNIFSELSHQWRDAGHEIHIITGKEWGLSEDTVEDCGVVYDKHFSIVDHHLHKSTIKMWNDDPRGDGWWMDYAWWVRSKGAYAKDVGIDVHFDDSQDYLQFFPKSCTYVIVPPKGFKNIRNLFLQ